MARSARVKDPCEGTACYHLMSRTNNKRFLFKDGELKTSLLGALKRAAAFSGIELMAYAIMDNHFHVVCKVVRRREAVSAEVLIERVAAIKGRDAADALARRWKRLAAKGDVALIEAEQTRLRDRMDDISEFIKTFKETFNIIFKRTCNYTGSIWSGRFCSTMIEDGKYMDYCRRYVYLNPVRAGIVRQAKDYRWAWCGGLSARPVPDGALMHRVAQVGGGTIFGSKAFVVRVVGEMQGKFRASGVEAHNAGGFGYSSHGWRLAGADAVA